MRLLIEHRTSYVFTTPQGRVVQLLRMTPGDTHDQTVAAWHIAVDRDARMTSHRDGFGNATTMLYCEGPVEQIEVTVSGEVVTSTSGGVLHGTTEILPPRFYLRTTPTTLADAAIAAFAAEAAGGVDVTALQRFNQAVRSRFGDDCARPSPALAAAEAFGRDTLTARDMAQVFIAGARTLGAPARYVSGYCDLAEDHRPTPHGWAEAHVEGVGWVGFDPWLGRLAEQHHVRVAMALDAAGAAPVAGSRLGEGRERLEVDVTVQGED
jgi:transglutaminase-like putative cysteine protease